MERNGRIHLDPDVLGPDMDDDGEIGQMPLSDLYGLCVFGTDAQQKAEEQRMQKEEGMGQIRQRVFEESGKDGDAWIFRIRAQIFQAAAGFSESVFPAPGTSSDTDVPQGAWIVFGMLVIVLLCIFLGGKYSMDQEGGQGK